MIKMSSNSVLDLILSAIISSNVFQTEDDKIWTTVARLVPSSSPEEVSFSCSADVIYLSMSGTAFHC